MVIEMIFPWQMNMLDKKEPVFKYFFQAKKILSSDLFLETFLISDK